MNICEDCKKKKLEQIDVKMYIGIGYNRIGTCELCKKETEYLFTYEEKDNE